MTRYNDREIIELFNDESTRHKAFTILVNQCKEQIYWLIRRIVVDHDDADDVLQNTFIKVWQGLARFREHSQLNSWIYRIAYNESITFLKQKRKNLAINESTLTDHLSLLTCQNTLLNCEEIETKLARAILQLPKIQQTVFNLRYYDELTYEQISAILGTTEGALRASYHLAMKKIEKILLND